MNCSMTKKDLAMLAGYSYRRLYDIDQGLPKEEKLFVKGEDGKYDLAIFVQRWVAYCVSNERETDDDLETAKARHELIKTQKTELEVRRMKGDLVDVQEIRRLWADVGNTVMQALIHIPSKIAPQLIMVGSVEAIASILDDEIRSALTQIAETPLPAYIAQNEDATEEDGDAD